MNDALLGYLPWAAGGVGVLFVVTFIGFYVETRSMSLTWLKMLSLARHLVRFRREARGEPVAPPVKAPKDFSLAGTISNVESPLRRVSPASPETVEVMMCVRCGEPIGPDEERARSPEGYIHWGPPSKRCAGKAGKMAGRRE